MPIDPKHVHVPTAIEYLRAAIADTEAHQHGMVTVHAHSIAAVLDAYDEHVRQDGPDAENALARWLDGARSEHGDQVSDLQLALMRRWSEVDPTGSVSRHPASNIENFRDLAKVALSHLGIPWRDGHRSPEPAPSGVRALRLPTPMGRRRWEAIDTVLRRYGVDTAHVATTSVEFGTDPLTLTVVERSGRRQTRRTIYVTQADVLEIEGADRG